jgi:hypothetical protein
MGVKDRNFPKQIGSTLLAGASGVLGFNGAKGAVDVFSALL